MENSENPGPPNLPEKKPWSKKRVLKKIPPPLRGKVRRTIGGIELAGKVGKFAANRIRKRLGK